MSVNSIDTLLAQKQTTITPITRRSRLDHDDPRFLSLSDLPPSHAQVLRPLLLGCFGEGEGGSGRQQQQLTPLGLAAASGVGAGTGAGTTTGTAVAGPLCAGAARGEWNVGGLVWLFG